MVDRSMSGTAGTGQDSPSGVAKKAGADAREVGKDIKNAAQEATERAKQEAARLGNKAKQQAEGYADEKKNEAGERIGTLASSLRASADKLENEERWLAGYVSSAADQLDDFSNTVRNRDVAEILQDVEGFARRQPALFLAGAAAIGFAAGRFMKASSDRRRQESYDAYDYGPADYGRADYGQTGSASMGASSSDRPASPADRQPATPAATPATGTGTGGTGASVSGGITRPSTGASKPSSDPAPKTGGSL
ncbi:MAG: hypothetical protein ACTS3R_20825 [Inquilinaceae bacterium]